MEPVELTFIANEPQCQAGNITGCYTADAVLYYYIGAPPTPTPTTWTVLEHDGPNHLGL